MWNIKFSLNFKKIFTESPKIWVIFYHTEFGYEYLLNQDIPKYTLVVCKIEGSGEIFLGGN